ncbi:MAG TPA: SAM-dependent chlorinase/fluorinase [Oceanobacillus sp.]|nr:SAM-dependent chlorinase/fluorinase [Oceanobacillus sp.]
MIGLLTDFGTVDSYVGVMKGVIYRIAPDVRIVDITHATQPQNVRQAAFTLMNSYRYFPTGTIFVVVVDPGVGSERRPVGAMAGGYAFVAPDNGVLSYTLAELGEYHAVALTNSEYQLADTSHTFHGRDIFAPAAAHLVAGVPLDAFGETLDDLMMLPSPMLRVEGKQITGEVVHIDHFGNIVTSIGQMHWVAPERLTLAPRFGENVATVPIPASETVVYIAGHTILGIQRTYSEVGRGELLAMIGSNGYLEIAVNQGNAGAWLDVSIGDEVTVRVG